MGMQALIIVNVCITV